MNTIASLRRRLTRPCVVSGMNIAMQRRWVAHNRRKFVTIHPSLVKFQLAKPIKIGLVFMTHQLNNFGTSFFSNARVSGLFLYGVLWIVPDSSEDNSILCFTDLMRPKWTGDIDWNLSTIFKILPRCALNVSGILSSSVQSSDASIYSSVKTSVCRDRCKARSSSARLWTALIGSESFVWSFLVSHDFSTTPDIKLVSYTVRWTTNFGVRLPITIRSD